jgi:hypothetical protein
MVYSSKIGYLNKRGKRERPQFQNNILLSLELAVFSCRMLFKKKEILYADK